MSTLWWRISLLTLFGIGWLPGGALVPAHGEEPRRPAAAEQLRRPSSAPLFTFQVISDIHLRIWNANAARKLQAALLDASRLSSAPAALIVNGDLGDGAADDYKTLSRLSHPERIWFTIGNHEFYQA